MQFYTEVTGLTIQRPFVPFSFRTANINFTLRYEIANNTNDTNNPSFLPVLSETGRARLEYVVYIDSSTNAVRFYFGDFTLLSLTTSSNP